jgi:hypothetical protein
VIAWYKVSIVYGIAPIVRQDYLFIRLRYLTLINISFRDGVYEDPETAWHNGSRAMEGYKKWVTKRYGSNDTRALMALSQCITR